MSDSVSFFDRYAPQAADSNLSEKTYQAADRVADEDFAHRLRIDYSNGDTSIFLYGNLISVYASGGALSLLFTSGMVYLEGDNLNELLDGLHDERIRTLRAYDPGRHGEPAYDPGRHGEPASDAAVIRLMEYQDIDEVVDGTDA